MLRSMSAAALPDAHGIPMSTVRTAGPRAVPLWWRDLSAAVAWALVLFVVSLWVAGGGLSFGNAADGITTLGRLTGLLASVLLLLQVLLMARIPLVEQAWGQDELARVHRLVGFSSFNLMLAHIALIVVGYAASAGSSVVSTFVEQVLTYPGMLLALAGTIALVLVVVTSIRAARTRLRYESWHLLHLYAYLGAGLALPHQLWTGLDFRSSAVATAFWWGLYAAALGAVLAFRLLLPALRSARHRLVVADVVVESPSVTTVVMAGRSLHRLPVRAGQFFQWRFLDGPGASRAKPFSLSAAPDGRTLRITGEAVGPGSDRLRTLRPGTRVLIEGPYGRLHAGAKVRRKTLLVGAGIGITPMRALLEELPAGREDTVLVYRVGRQDDLVLTDELLDLAQDKGAKVVAVVGHRNRERASWLPAQLGHLDDAEALLRIAPDVADRDVFVCGHPPWMDAVQQAARAAGVPAEAVHSERFSY